MRTFRRELEKGMALFNAGRFWEAHEAWEGPWRERAGEERAGEERALLQGLIQLAAACHHVASGHPRGAGKLFERALAHLHGISEVTGGLALAELTAAVDLALERFQRGEDPEVHHLTLRSFTPVE